IGGDFVEAGLPAYDLLGSPVGVLSNQTSAEGAEEGESTVVVLLPLDAVAKSLAQAKKRVPDAVAKAKEAKETKEPKEPAMDGATEPAMGETPAMGEAPAPDPKEPKGAR